MATHQKKHMQSRGTKELIFRDGKEGEEYAEVLKAIGDCRFECQFLNTEITQAKLAGALIKGPRKQRIVIGDFVVALEENRSIDESITHLLHMTITGLIGIIGTYFGMNNKNKNKNKNE